jgi:hypothetical protein
MANPNIFSITSITGKTDGFDLVTTATPVVTNPANSNKVYKVNLVVVTNYTGNDATVTVDMLKSAVSFPVAYNVTVPAFSTLMLITKDSSFYIEEGSQVRAIANVASTLKCVISYEILE